MKKSLSPRGVYERSISEEDVLGTCRTLLELYGARVFRAVERVPKCYRCGQWLGSSERGTPDISGYFTRKPHAGVPFWIEMKRPKAAHRPAQEARIAMIQSDGMIAFFAHSLDSMIREFKDHGIDL